MSYEVLARRWRPQTFDEVVGQRHVTVTLRNALQSGRLSHAILLCGPRGIGKTTIARILARSLNCDQGPTDKPCGKCSPCLEIAASTSLDVQEIDAASHTGVDNVREIRESIRFAASPGKYRIFIIDEVHMLSQAAFNALLKTLEEPPPSSLFIFATTDPQKIPVTVLSRVQRFDLRRLGAAELQEMLREICRTEQIEIQENVLRALIREADGSARDVLTLLDRLLSGLGKKISEEEAIEILDLIDRRILRDVLDPVLARDPAAALAAVRRALAKGVAPTRLAAELLSEIRNLVVARIVDDPEGLIEGGPDEVQEIRERARPHSTETLQRLFRVLLTRTQDLAFAARPDHAIEMALVRLATLPEGEALAGLIARLDALEGGSGPGGDSSGGSSGSGGRGSRAGKGSGGRAQAGSRSGSEDGAPAEAEMPPPQEEPGNPTGAQRAARAPGRPTDPAKEAQLRREAKDHPAVREVIEVLDAELRNIRIGEQP
jgi:DNA polymerase-3 subunit gamma/tau